MRNLYHSTFAISLALWALLNAFLCVSKPLSAVAPDQLPAEHGWAWWAVQNWRAQSRAPNVVLVGSSLLMNPIWENEAEFLGKDVDITVNRCVHYLGSALEKRLPADGANCFNLALPGAMLSDDYMVARTLLSGANKPNVVVLGLSPRDFVDNNFRGAASSAHYKYLSRFTDTDDLTALAMPQIWQRMTFYLRRACYLEDKKADLQIATSAALVNISNQLLGAAEAPRQTDAQASQAIYQSELEKGVWIAHPRGSDYYHETEFDKLRNKFAKPNRECLNNQKQWFDMFMALCQKNGIRTVVVNMPITETNIALFAPGVYQECISLMADEARKYGCPFLNLQESKEFVITDFTDMCHMDASGGRKALDCIAATIASDEKAARALSRGQFASAPGHPL